MFGSVITSRCQSVNAQMREERREHFEPVPKILQADVLVGGVLIIVVIGESILRQ